MRSTKRVFFVASTVLALLGTGAAHATILTFDIPGIFDFQAANQAYGDRVTGLSDAIGSYGEAGEGFTGNIEVDYGTHAPALWTTGYSDLTNVLFDDQDGQGPLAVTLTADAGFEVLLYEFDLGSWFSDSTVNSIRVTDQDNTVLYESLSETIFGNGHTNVAFNGPLSGSTLYITIDQTNLGSNSDNVGIDNIRFGQQAATVPVPEPATITLLGAGLAALAARARRKQA